METQRSFKNIQDAKEVICGEGGECFEKERVFRIKYLNISREKNVYAIYMLYKIVKIQINGFFPLI